MVNWNEFLNKIENANRVTVNYDDGAITSYADFGDNFTFNVDPFGQTIEFVAQSGFMFDCPIDEIESGDEENDGIVFDHNGATVTITIINTTNN